MTIRHKCFRRNHNKGGDDVKENIITQQKNIAAKQLETILLELRIGERQFVLISGYKPPSVDNINTITIELT